MQDTLERMRKDIEDFSKSIPTCAYDKRAYVLNLLAEQLCGGIADLAEELTDESSRAVYDCAEFIIDNINAMFSEAADKAEDRRSNPSEPARDFEAA
jgi:hypothetical protein